MGRRQKYLDDTERQFAWRARRDLHQTPPSMKPHACAGFLHRMLVRRAALGDARAQAIVGANYQETALKLLSAVGFDGVSGLLETLPLIGPRSSVP